MEDQAAALLLMVQSDQGTPQAQAHHKEIMVV
jgi:hypothetical protein